VAQAQAARATRLPAPWADHLLILQSLPGRIDPAIARA
jgi:hypothetical protein